MVPAFTGLSAPHWDHYALSFGQADSWSLKYNLVWDRIWKSGLFSDRVYDKEIAFYLKKQNMYVATCIKHFAAYGGVEAGRDYNAVECSERELREFYLPAYQACMDAGAEMLMPSFNSLNGLPSVANPWLMKQVLKEEWGFDGVAISDYNAVGELLAHGVAADEKEAAKLAFDNGCDIEMCSSA